MAFTVVKNKVAGNKTEVQLKITADAATQAIETGLAKIDHFVVGLASMNSSNIKLAANLNASGVAANGTLAVTGCTSGDLFYVTVYGR